MKMDKNDFDSEYDLEKELGFDPREFLGEEPAAEDQDLDLSEFAEGDLDFDLHSGSENADDYDFDIDNLDLDGDAYAADDYGPEPYDSEEYAGENQDPGFEDGFLEDGDSDGFLEDEEDVRGSYQNDEEILNATRRFEEPVEDYDQPAYDGPGEDYGEPAYDAPAGDQPEYDESAYDGPEYDADAQGYDQPYAGDEDDEDLDPDAPAEEYDEEDDDPEPEKKERRKKREKPARAPRPRKEKKVRPKKEGPGFFTKFMGIYFAPVLAEATRDPNAPDPNPRRKKLSKKRLFKEVYLPPLILCLALIMVLTCIVGSMTHAIQRKKLHDEAAMQESIDASNQQAQVAEELRMIMQQSEIMAAGYDYEGAIKLIESYSDFANAPQEMLTRKAEYTQAQNLMREWKDPALIPNLSFHVLIADPAKAFSDKEFGGQYNRNFVTIDEFQKILESLYKSNYVLVDFDSFVDRNTGVDGKESFFVKPILLPEGKQPVMITETMVNYFNYMIDIDPDGPDGFASRLVVDGNGDIKAELVDANGQSQIGNFDLVPILEDFIKVHPDFAYRGARATLAVTGSEGIFGYRINTSAISDPNLGTAYHEEQVAGATALVQALRNKGYTIGSYTYSNQDYYKLSVKQINKELQDWNSQVKPVLGDVDLIVFARGSDINDYTGSKFKALYDGGFRYFVGMSTTDKPTAEVTPTYVHQKRLEVSGNAIQWHPDRFKGMFDCAAVKNPTRGDVPN